jgi:hypothetical protein
MVVRYTVNSKFHPENLNKVLNLLDKITRLAEHCKDDGFLKVLTSMRITFDAWNIDQLIRKNKSALLEYKDGIIIKQWYVYGILPLLQIFVWIALLPPLLKFTAYLISLIVKVFIAKSITWDNFFKYNSFGSFIQNNLNSFTFWGLIGVFALWICFKINHKDSIYLTDTFAANKEELVKARNELTEGADIIREIELEMERQKQQITVHYSTLGSTIENAISNFLVQKIADGSFQNADLREIKNLIRSTFEEFDVDRTQTPRSNRFGQSPTIATDYNNQDNSDDPFS